MRSREFDEDDDDDLSYKSNTLPAKYSSQTFGGGQKQQQASG